MTLQPFYQVHANCRSPAGFYWHARQMYSYLTLPETFSTPIWRGTEQAGFTRPATYRPRFVELLWSGKTPRMEMQAG